MSCCGGKNKKESMSSGPDSPINRPGKAPPPSFKRSSASPKPKREDVVTAYDEPKKGGFFSKSKNVEKLSPDKLSLQDRYDVLSRKNTDLDYKVQYLNETVAELKGVKDQNVRRLEGEIGGMKAAVYAMAKMCLSLQDELRECRNAAAGGSSPTPGSFFSARRSPAAASVDGGIVAPGGAAGAGGSWLSALISGIGGDGGAEVEGETQSGAVGASPRSKSVQPEAERKRSHESQPSPGGGRSASAGSVGADQVRSWDQLGAANGVSSSDLTAGLRSKRGDVDEELQRRIRQMGFFPHASLSEYENKTLEEVQMGVLTNQVDFLERAIIVHRKDGYRRDVALQYVRGDIGRCLTRLDLPTQQHPILPSELPSEAPTGMTYQDVVASDPLPANYGTEEYPVEAATSSTTFFGRLFGGASGPADASMGPGSPVTQHLQPPAPNAPAAAATIRRQRNLTFGPKDTLNERLKKIDEYDWDDDARVGRVDTRKYGRPLSTRGRGSYQNNGSMSPSIPVTKSPLSRKADLFAKTYEEERITSTAFPVGKTLCNSLSFVRTTTTKQGRGLLHEFRNDHAE